MNNFKRNNNDVVFFNFFCLWLFVLLIRPQDMFQVLKPFRPALVTGVLTLLFYFASEKKLFSSSLLKSFQMKYYIELFIIMIIGIPFSVYPRMAFNNIFLWYINTFIFVVVFFNIVNSIDKLHKILFIGCSGCGLYSLFSIMSGSFGGNRLYFGSMFDPNDLAFFALSFMPLNLIFFSKNNSFFVRIVCFVSFFANLLLVVLTGSRGGFLSLVVVFILLLFSKTKSVSLRFKSLSVAMVLVVFSLSIVHTDRIMSLANIDDDYNVQADTGRLSLWKFGVSTMFSNPLTGVGVGNFKRAVGYDRAARGASTLKWQAAHNSLVQIGAETGILGLILFLILSLNALKIFRKTKISTSSDLLLKISELGFIGFVGMFTAAFFLSQAYSLYWAFYVVISAVVNRFFVDEQSHCGFMTEIPVGRC